jgi:hypothetical protein
MRDSLHKLTIYAGKTTWTSPDGEAEHNRTPPETTPVWLNAARACELFSLGEIDQPQNRIDMVQHLRPSLIQLFQRYLYPIFGHFR